MQLILTPGGEGSIGCDAGNRLPENAYPPFSTTIRVPLTNLNHEDVEVKFTADREVLFSDVSVEILDPSGLRHAGEWSVVYCREVLVDRTDISEYRTCCQRKPIFIVGVKENKNLIARVSSYNPPPEWINWVAEVTYSGIQGKGCCGA